MDSMNVEELALYSLRSVRRIMENPENWEWDGICNSFRGVLYETTEGVKICDRAMFLLISLFRTWPKYSGHLSYPITLNKNIDPSHYYHIGSNGMPDSDYMWNRKISPYAALRWELLEHCISELEKNENVVQETDQEA